MMGNYHVRFLGGKGAEKPLTYPVWAEVHQVGRDPASSTLSSEAQSGAAPADATARRVIADEY
jgi:hypothetical protein